MNDSVFEAVETSSRILRLDFSSIEFARLAEEQDFSEEQIQAVGMVFAHLQRKKVDTTIHTLLKMSRLPLKCKFQPLSTTCTEKQLHFHGDSAPLSRA